MKLCAESKNWLFSAIDVVVALSKPKIPRNYWSELHEKIVQLKLPAEDGKLRETDMLNKDGILLLAKRINSAQTEAFIDWITQFGCAKKNYLVKHKNIDVIEIGLDDNGSILAFGKLFNDAHLSGG